VRSRNLKGVPVELRNNLEKARQEQLALFRGLDRVDVSAQEMPQKEIKKLMELDADCAEALWALDNPRGLNLRKMVRDTEKSLLRIPKVRKELLAKLPERVLIPLANHEAQILTTLTLQDAYRDIPGKVS
jgi:hypothetical protein